MNPEKIAILTAGAQTITDAPGGHVSITFEDIAGQLAKLSPEATMYARLKWGLEDSYKEDLIEIMYYAVRRWKDIGNWRVTRPDFMLDMCKMVLSEAVDMDKCLWCHGQESRLINHKLVECSNCKGTGAKRIEEKDRAEYLGVSEQSYSNTWRDRCRRIAVEFTDRWEGEVWSLKRE